MEVVRVVVVVVAVVVVLVDVARDALIRESIRSR